ncbi:unnamed protein product [Rotaria socialis]|uniref:DUF4037 domain-containing protein n=2 Tax=Rotaria socialis TaxID=392032 RepID=A0A818P6W3_9BILA|nr:unnamed protein product [Rotaria socialis]CAF3549266.1 unnamed protein product [Rotaria socialis]CAF3615643.1 unnamed protein product [Rotaria socialis]CAF4242764.1 unnamed protein product [Rotaria socialis]CAF4411233.1 unnamed protein product [Rotaria socialis]
MPYPDGIAFVHGLDLSERFFFDIVKPLLDQYYPLLQYTACCLGPGSDVLRFDSIQSRDHDWGPKFDLFVENEENIDELNSFFNKNLRKKTVCGYSTQFQPYLEENGRITLINTSNDQENTCHGIRIITMKQFFIEYLNWAIDNGEPTLEDWLTFPSQHLLTIARGRVFHHSDNMNIEHIRSRLAYYPNDIWLYLMGCCWQRIGQEEHLMGRAGQANDELGSSLIANRLIRDIMRLIFLLEKQFFPYPKWFGTGFRQLTTYGSDFESILRQVQLANTWQQREYHLSIVYQHLANITKERLFNKIENPKDTITTEISQFHNRPFQVINGGSIADVIFNQIENNHIRQLPKIGSIDLFADSTDVMVTELRLKMKKIFE